MHDIDWTRVGWLVGLIVCLAITIKELTTLRPTLGLLYVAILGCFICGYRVYFILTGPEDDG